MRQGRSWACDLYTTLPNESSEKGKQVFALEKGNNKKNQKIIIKDLAIVTKKIYDAFVVLVLESKNNIWILNNKASKHVISNVDLSNKITPIALGNVNSARGHSHVIHGKDESFRLKFLDGKIKHIFDVLMS